MAAPRYRIRYRLTTIASVAVLVEDEVGRLLVCSRAGLRPYLGAPHDPARRAALLRHLGWLPVPRVAPSTLAGLRRLLGAAVA